MHTLQLEIVTPEKTIFSAVVNQVTLPTMMGEITVLPNHVPMVSALAAGMVRIASDGGEMLMSISRGFIEIQHHRVIVLAETAERAEEIDVAKAQAARDEAQKSLSEQRLDREEYANTMALLEKQLARLRVAERHRSRRASQQIERGELSANKEE